MSNMSIYEREPLDLPEKKEELKPLAIFLHYQVSGKRLTKQGGGDFLTQSSKKGQISRQAFIHSIVTNSQYIPQTQFGRVKPMDLDPENLTNAFFVSFRSGRPKAMYLEREREDFAVPFSKKRGVNKRVHLHKEAFDLGESPNVADKIANLMRQGYAIYPQLFVSGEKYNFDQVLNPKKIILDSPDEIGVKGKSGNFWNQKELATKSYLPIIVKILVALNNGKKVLLSSIHPETRQPIDTYSRLLVFQAIQHLILANPNNSLISFLSSPLVHSASDLTFWDPGDRIPFDKDKKMIRISSQNISLNEAERGIERELEELFLNGKNWLKSHQEWVNDVGSKLLT